MKGSVFILKTINKRILSAFMVGIMIVQLIFPVFQSSVYAQEILENESNSLTIENQEATSNLSDSLEELGEEVTYSKDEIEIPQEDEIFPVDKSSDLDESPPKRESEGLIDNSAQDPRDAETYRESIRIEQNLLSNFELTIYDKDSNPTVINKNDVLEIDPSEINAAQIKYGIKIPGNFDVQNGDTYEIDLPDFFEGDIKMNL